jgi:hypothetical protein
MKSKRSILARLIALVAVIGLACVMFVVGRGHTIYFDNKDLEAGGQKYEAFYKVEVFVGDESVAKLKAGDRGMVTTMGQKFRMVLHITPKEGEKKYGSAVSLKLPYNMDGIILNIPAILAGAPEEVYMSEFIPAPVTETEEDIVVTDEFELPSE